MKKIIWYCMLLLLVAPQLLRAQVAINTDASLPNASAMLEIKTNNKGFLGPRLNTAQRTGILSPADGLWVYDTDTKSFWFCKGSIWVEITSGASSGSFVIPYSATQGYTNYLFSLSNISTGGVASFSNSNASTTANLLNVTGVGPGVIANHNTGNAANFFMNNTNGVGAGVRGEVNSIFGNNGTAGVYGTASGTGGYGGYFEHAEKTGYGLALYANSQGLGTVLGVDGLNAATTNNIVNVTANGPGVIADHKTGNAGNFFMNNTNGVGAGVRGEVNSIFGNNGTAGVYGVSSGTGGYGGYFEHLEKTGYGIALYTTSQGLGTVLGVDGLNAATTNNIVNVTANGPGVIADHKTGNAGNFFMNNTNGVGAGVRGEVNSIFGNNGTAGVYGVSSGTGGYGGYFEHLEKTGYGIALYTTSQGLGTVLGVDGLNASSTNNIVNVTANGPGVIANHSTGNAANFFMNNTSGVGAGVRGEVNSIFGNNGTAGVYGVSSGTGGYGGYFEHTNATGYGVSLYATTSGQGIVADFATTPATNSQPTLRATTVGTGNAASFRNSNANNTANTLDVTSNGPGVIADHKTGNAGNFFMNNTTGVGAGVRGEVNSIFGNNGTAGVYGVSSGTGGYGGYFEHTETTGFGIALQVVTNGQGSAMVVDHLGAAGNIAVFRGSNANRARIDHNGRGYFNGGTQNSGADLAEAFDVSGSTAAYEPGDVLAIAVDADRTVQKSQEAYSSLVVGVYATKPGVLLTEENIDSKLEDKVPMGVVGVIPTKVCNENGAIRRGDILVTASKPGYAMKADLNKLKPGQAIGKALQEFDGETGKIKVLVNVR